MAEEGAQEVTELRGEAYPGGVGVRRDGFGEEADGEFAAGGAVEVHDWNCNEQWLREAVIVVSIGWEECLCGEARAPVLLCQTT